MRFLKLTVAYDGTDYCGWQVQLNQVSIQQRLEEGWQKISGESRRMVGSGRTDGGVHAEGQVCSLATESTLPLKTLVRALNAETPFDISILKIEEAPNGFHAIRDAISKTYRYQIQYGRLRDPLRRRFWWHVPRDLDLDAMRRASELLRGTFDFVSFQSAGAERDSTVRTITQLDLLDSVEQAATISGSNIDPNGGQIGLPTIKLTISADGFLYKMVRNIVGSLVRVGERKESPDWIAWVVEQKNRMVAGQAAPAHGLFLQQVDYPEFAGQLVDR